MKNLLACFAVLLAFTAGAQSTMPYNPDFNDDSYIGSADILGLLPFYGQQYGIDSSLTCSYDGTPIEEIVGGLWDGSILIDSVRVQYHLQDSALIYLPGCPDPIWESASYETTWVGYGSFNNGDWYFNTSSAPYKTLRMQFYESSGWYSFRFTDNEISALGLSSILGGGESWALGNVNQAWVLPFDTLDYSFSEYGVQFTEFDGYLHSQTYNSILFYWQFFE